MSEEEPQPHPSWQPAPEVGEDPPELTGRRKAVLIGVNYFGTSAELKGCINDVHSIKELLAEHGWEESDETMIVLTDDQEDPSKQPTRDNIMSACRWLTDGAEAGDVLFFHYSGHGAQQADPEFAEEDGMDETICPVDMASAGQITDGQLAEALVQPLPSGVRLTAILDCCHSGTGLDLPFMLKLQGGNFEEDTNPWHTSGDVIFFSGCLDEQTSADFRPRYGAPAGAMTSAFTKVARSGEAVGQMNYHDLMSALDGAMREGGFTQRPQCSATQCFDVDARRFGFDDIQPNTNPMVGRQFKVKHKKPRRKFDGGLAQMLAAGPAGYLAVASALYYAKDAGEFAETAGELLLDGAEMLTGGMDEQTRSVATGFCNCFAQMLGQMIKGGDKQAEPME